MQSNAVQKIVDLALAADGKRIVETGCVPTIILRGEEELKSLEAFACNRSRFRGTLNTDSIAAFNDYTAAQPANATRVFVDPTNVSAVSFFNLGDAAIAGHGDHRAQFKAVPTAPYKALLDMVGKPVNQRTLIDYVEDWAPYVGLVPFGEGYSGIENPMSLALAAVRSVKIDQKKSTTSEQQDFKQQRTSMESIEAAGRERPLPAGFGWTGVPYDGFTSRLIQLRLSLRTAGDEPALVLRVAAAGRLTEELGDELVKLISAKVSAPILRGTFALG